MISDQIKNKISPGMVIPKPVARADFIVKGWGKRRGEPALIYQIPNHNPFGRPYEKGITISEFEMAYQQLDATGFFTRKWFQANMTACDKEGSCNFTTIGGIFKLLGYARYTQGAYKSSREVFHE